MLPIHWDNGLKQSIISKSICLTRLISRPLFPDNLCNSYYIISYTSIPSISLSFRHGSAVIRHIVAISKLTDLGAVRGLTQSPIADVSEGSEGGGTQLLRLWPWRVFRDRRLEGCGTNSKGKEGAIYFPTWSLYCRKSRVKFRRWLSSSVGISHRNAKEPVIT